MFNHINKKDIMQQSVFIILIISTFILATICFLTKDYLVGNKLIDLILIIFTGTLNIICIGIINRKKYIFSSFLGITSVIITLIRGMFFLVTYEGYMIEFFNNFILVTMFVKFIAEYFIIILAIFYTNKKISYKKVSKASIYTYLILILTIFGVSKNIYLNQLEDIVIALKYLIIISTVVLFIISLAVVNNNKSNIEESMFIATKRYLSLIFVSQMIFFVNIYGFKSFHLGALYFFKIFSFLAYVILYKEALSSVLNESFQTIKDKIEKSEASFKKNNNILQKKRNTLTELNSLIETGKDSYEKIIQCIEDSIFIFKDNKLNYINDGALNLLDIKECKTLIKKSFDEIFSLILDLEIKTVNNVKFSNEEYYREVVLKSSNGRFIDVEVYSLPFEKNSRLLLIRDVTVINRARKVNLCLEKYFQEEYVKRDFFSNISHELRTPINVIFSALQLNDIYIIKNNLNSMKKNNKIIKQNCLRLIRTINNFIDANKISEGFISPDFQVLNVVEVVENIAQAASKNINKAGLELIFDSEREEIFIEIDKGFLERVVLNILSNSVKYGKDGGKILINIFVKDSNIMIIIENDGYIISEEEQQYMFQKFSKNNMAFNRTQEGSGLGLYISKSLMELQGGNLIVEVGVEKGNKFIINYDNVRLFKDIENYENSLSSLNEIMEKVDIEFSDIVI